MNAARLSRRSKSRGAPGRPLAFTGFWVLVGSVGPLSLTNASDARGFLSLRRLKRQMFAVKQRGPRLSFRMLLDPVVL